MGEFAASIERSKAKSVSASGGLAPLTPRPGSLPLDPAGGSALRPPYRLALCALAMAPLPNPKYATVWLWYKNNTMRNYFLFTITSVYNGLLAQHASTAPCRCSHDNTRQLLPYWILRHCPHLLRKNYSTCSEVLTHWMPNAWSIFYILAHFLHTAVVKLRTVDVSHLQMWSSAVENTSHRKIIPTRSSTG